MLCIHTCIGGAVHTAGLVRNDWATQVVEVENNLPSIRGEKKRGPHAASSSMSGAWWGSTGEAGVGSTLDIMHGRSRMAMGGGHRETMRTNAPTSFVHPESLLLPFIK